MRLIRIMAPSGLGPEVISTAFADGIESVSLYQVDKHSAADEPKTNDVVDISTSTPKAKRFIADLLEADYFDRTQFSISVRQPRSIISGEDISDLTQPVAEPPTDLAEELWQFSHITYSLIGRVFIAACLLAYGLIQQQTLLMIGGLLFMPLLPMLSSIGLGAFTRQWRLAVHGLAAFVLSSLLLVLGGALVATVSSPPLRYDTFNSILISLLISLGVGIAAGLATIDDVGRRELIGLAAAAQIGVIPVWAGISLVFGLSPTTSEGEAYSHIFSFFVNVFMIIIGSLAVHFFSGVAIGGLARLEAFKVKASTFKGGRQSENRVA
jgi:hypothetical protein